MVVMNRYRRQLNCLFEQHFQILGSSVGSDCGNVFLSADAVTISEVVDQVSTPSF